MGHPGIAKMKSLARRYVWWPNMGSSLEKRVKGCATSQKLPSQGHCTPGKPQSRVHVDYAGPFMVQMFLMIIDAHSNWLEVYITSSATTSTTIEKLRDDFSQFGLSEIIVSDNATCLISDEYQQFLKANHIRHAKSTQPQMT